MKLKLVEIYGFKSFAQRTELSFDKGITGIVGPNGSGKSNIADAVRWVLGEQSARLLRGAKMEDVIFSGTEKRKALPYCEVSLLFDNEDRALNSPYAEVLVTRRAYRSGEGEYYLNKTACRLKDLLNLFRDTGIGKEGYSIIGQGRIEEILSSRGEERRQAFEEAAGIVTYRVRKQEAERKLQRTEENLLRIQDIIEELANRLVPLEEHAKTARAYLELSERLRSLDLNVFLVRHERLGERITGLRKLNNDLRETIAAHEAQLRALAEEREVIEQELEQLDQADQRARDAQNSAQKLVFQTQSDLQAQKNQRQALAEELERKQQEAADISARLEELASLLSDTQADAQQQSKGEALAEAALLEEQETLKLLMQDAQQKEELLDAHKERFVAVLNRLGDTKAAQARQRAMLEQAQRRQAEIEQNAIAAQTTLDEANLTVQTATEGKLQVESDLQVLKAEEAALKQSLELLSKENEQRTAQSNELLMTLRANQSRLSVLEDMARDYEGYASAVKLALRFAGNDGAVHGVVADILRVPKAYETAIEMIMGGALQHIVTNDEETAKRLIDYLRTNRLGRTTFLPISAIRSRTLNQGERQLISGPDVFGVASDLVGFEPQFRGIVENLLGRTVIVKDLEAAISLSRSARQSFHVVTLAGDVMRAGGAMTGGTSQARSSSLLGRRREMEELQKAIQRDQEQAVALQREVVSARARFHALSSQAEEAAEAVNQQSILVAREQERLETALSEQRRAQQASDALQTAVQQLEETAETIRGELESVAQQANHDQIDQKEMESQTAAMQEALQQARMKTEEQRLVVASRQEQLLHFTHAADLLKRDSDRFMKEQAALEVKQQQLEREAKALAERGAQAVQAVDAGEAALSQAQAKEAQCAKAWEQVSQARSACQNRQRACAQQTEAAHGLHAKDSEKLHRNELVTARTENELQSLGDYILNTYDLTYGGAQEFRVEGKLELPKAELEIKDLKRQIRDMGIVHVGAIEEYAATMERYQHLETQRQDAVQAKEDLLGLIEQLLGKMEKQFKQEFAKLSAYFSETFTRLFGGGQAELILTDPSAPLTCDIDVLAQPPGKKLQLLSLLSGGERALTAIAILFAMLKLKPTPFCILDEIEAALDEANIGHFADYLSEYAQSTQFIVITHRKGTMQRCDALYGVSMEEKGVSSMVSVDLQRYA